MLKKSYVCLFLTFLSIKAKIIRNNNMISFYENGQRHSMESNEKSYKNERILLTMQKVLCRNFPKIPCSMITKDETLRKLISQSIQQMNYKTISFENKRQDRVINSEDLSNFLRVKHTGFFTNDGDEPKKVKVRQEKKSKDDIKTFGRKKIKKFYPHKYKEGKKNGVSKEKNSLSEEFTDVVSPHKPLGPIWRMDYTEKGSSFGKYKGGHEHAVGRRNKEVYIKKAFVRGADED